MIIFNIFDRYDDNKVQHITSNLNAIIVTGHGKTDLIYTNTLVCIMACISCSVCAIPNLLVLLNSSWISAYNNYYYDDILDTILITDKTSLHFKLSKSGQILRVDKAGFPRHSHN